MWTLTDTPCFTQEVNLSHQYLQSSSRWTRLFYLTKLLFLFFFCPSGSEVSLSHSMSESAKPHHPGPPPKGEKTHVTDSSYVGIDAILEQMRRKAMKQCFEFNIMVVGECHVHFYHIQQKRSHQFDCSAAGSVKRAVRAVCLFHF